MAANDIYIDHGSNGNSGTEAVDLKVHKVTPAFKIPYEGFGLTSDKKVDFEKFS